MYCNQIFSLLDESSTVQNIIVADNYEIANRIAKDIYGTNAFALETTKFPIQIGDKFNTESGLFYRTNEIGEFEEIHAEPSVDDTVKYLENRVQNTDKEIQQLTEFIGNLMFESSVKELNLINSI